MPFEADTRCPYMRVSLNTNYVAELLEDLLEMEYLGNYILNENELYFKGYVELIEDSFSCYYCNTPILNFTDWFCDNYSNNSEYCFDEVVERCFTKRETDN